MKELQLEYLDLSDIIPYENNPRHNDEAVDYVANSIKEFGFKVPIIIDENNVIVTGHTRLKACEKLGLKKAPCIRADDLTEDQIKAFRLADNKVGEIATWDLDKLNLELENIDFDMTPFGFENIEIDLGSYFDKFDHREKDTLAARFIVPPFSILDSTSGKWQNRKKEWLKKTGNLSETRDGEFGLTSTNSKNSLYTSIGNGTSNFDPVFAEIVYTWFCPDGGKILDPFGGEQTKGVVAGELGLSYRAVEIRQDQIDVNRSKVAQYKDVEYVCGDSNNIDTLIKENDFDLCFTSPPYYDLEVYSKEDLSSLGSYEEFMRQYKNIFQKCYDKLKEDSFLVLKVGEIRNKKTGIYRGFVPDNIRVMNEIGWKFYNEIILATSIGTASLRANLSMRTRKIVKRHQNVLVFYKGNPSNIVKKFKPIECTDEELLDAGE